MGPRSKFVAFMAQRFEASRKPDLEVKKEEEKPVEKTLIYEKESEEMKRLIDKAREAEWQKYSIPQLCHFLRKMAMPL